MNKNAPLLLLTALLAAVLLAGCSSPDASSAADPPQSETESGSSEQGALSSFSADTLDGGTYTQEDLAARDLTVINFWGTFCGPCIAEMPDLAAFAKALPDNVELITVCVDAESDPDGAEALLRQAGYEGVTLTGGDGDFLPLLQAVQAVPTTVFVDSQGNLVGEAIIGGGFDNFSEVFLEAVNAALEEGGKDAISLAE